MFKHFLPNPVSHCKDTINSQVATSSDQPLQGQVPANAIRLVPITFILYQFSLLLFVVCFTVVFAVDNDCQKEKS